MPSISTYSKNVREIFRVVGVLIFLWFVSLMTARSKSRRGADEEGEKGDEKVEEEEGVRGWKQKERRKEEEEERM